MRNNSTMSYLKSRPMIINKKKEHFERKKNELKYERDLIYLEQVCKRM